MDTADSLLRAILATVARRTFPTADIYKIVAPVAGSDKQLAAYNLCDGETPQAEIGKRAKLDKGNLSRSISRWIEAGIVVRVGEDQYPMHVYPLTRSGLKSPGAER
jgi:DNA-binding HxlR family transcriptional regulator